jgi:hypothetical protein
MYHHAQLPAEFRKWEVGGRTEMGLVSIYKEARWKDLEVRGQDLGKAG